MLILDPEGNLVDSYPQEIDVHFAEIGMDHYREKDSLMSDAFLLNGKAHFLVSSFIKDEDLFEGYLIAVVKLEAINNITNNIRLGTTGEAYLVNEQGYFVTHQDQFAILTKILSPPM